MLKQTKRALASTGVRVHDIELARVYEGLHPTKYLPAMEVAAELGAKAVLSSIWGGEREFYIEKFAESATSPSHSGSDGGPRVRADRRGGATSRRRSTCCDGRPQQCRADDRHAPLPPRRRRPAELARCRASGSTSLTCATTGRNPTERQEMIRILREGRWTSARAASTSPASSRTSRPASTRSSCPTRSATRRSATPSTRRAASRR